MINFDSGKLQLTKHLIDSSSRITIFTHMHPDGDAIGSATAMYSYLSRLGKKAKILLNDACPSYLGFLTGGEAGRDIIVYGNNPEAVLEWMGSSDLCVCLDFNSIQRMDALGTAASTLKCDKILIDHHLAPAEDEFTVVFSRQDISSASELTYWLLKELSGKDGIPRTAMTSLMTGMTTDTNNFANSVFPSTLQMASELLEAGVDRDSILEKLYNSLSENRLRLMGYLMKDILEITEDGVALITLSKEDISRFNIKEGETEGFVNMPLSIDRVKMSVFCKEDETKARVSLRSKRGVSANRCAGLFFNGGGHEQAAGGKLLYGKDIDGFGEAAEYIRKNTHLFMTENNGQDN